MSNPTPILNNINAFDATKGTTISFNIIGGTDIVRSNIAYIYDLSTNDLICTHLYISTESIHELPPNTDPSIVYADGKSSADFVNNKNYYLQIQTFTNTAGTAGGSGMSVAKTFWCLFNPALSVNTIPAAISTTSYNVGATYTTNITDATIPVTNIIQQYKFDLYTATGTLVQTSGNIIGSGEQEGTSTTYNITYNFSGLVVNNSYYVVVTTTSTEGMTVSAQSNTFTVSIDTPTVGGAIVNNNACDGYISVVSNLSDEYGGHVSGEMASFETDSVNNVSSLKVNMEPIQEGSGTPSPTNIRPIRGHSGVNAYVSPTQSADDGTKYSQEFDVSLTPTSTDKVPYTFKAVGRDVYGDRESDKIIGGTVAWNQLVQNGNFENTDNWFSSNGTLTAADNIVTMTQKTEDQPYANVAQSSSARQIVQDHRYLYMVSIKSEVWANSGNAVVLAIGGFWVMPLQASRLSTNAWNDLTGIYTGHANVNWLLDLRKYYESSLAPMQVKNFRVFDLTAMFGTSVADAIYAMEQAHTGDGVAWCKRYEMFRKYTPYNAGELMSVKALSHVTTGKNLLPPWVNSQTINGVKWVRNSDDSLTSSGSAGSTASQVVSSDFLVPVGRYVLTGVQIGGSTNTYFMRILCYGYDGSLVNYGTDVGGGYYIDIDESVARIRVFVSVRNTNATLTWKPMLRVRDTDADYEPYSAHTYPLPNVELRGIPKWVNGKLSYDGDVLEPSGRLTRKYGIVDLGTLNWVYYSDYQMFYANAVGRKAGVDNLLCSKYRTTNAIFTVSNDKAVGGNASNNIVYIRDTSYTDAATFKTAMSGVYLVYELATPTTETAEPFTNPQVVDNWGTEAYVTTGIVPVGHDSEYLTRDIFSGTLDLVTGVLTVDKKMVTLDGSSDEPWVKNVGYGGYRLGILSDANIDGIPSQQLLSDKFIGSNQRGASDVTAGKLLTYTNNTGADTQYVFFVTDVTTIDAWRTWLSNNPTQLVYPLATPQTYQLTPHQIQTLVGQNNVWSDEGDVDVTFNLPISNLLVKRQDASDVSGNWLTLYSQPITQASDMDFTYIDFLNQYGKTYRYALVPLLTQQQGDIDVEIEGGYTVSDDVLSVFDGVFIANNNGSQKLKAATEYGDLETNQDVGVLTTIGGKYPFVVSNSNLNYHSGSISALIVPSDFYTSGDLDRLSIVERREAIEQFLTDKTAKILKDWNGNIWLITFVENVEVSFVDDYGMGLGTLSAKWVEIGDVNDQTDLKQTGLI